ncbi:hypothetical protein CR201_G0038939 [Pongo abelii]|uniref:Uncharacterized protein n=1 Tax=Pongo abelii TaxID=9601 RepID=A0A2J8T0I3_PONAB|nr:hypothetical protein CR201_G0038939 [Pongo abelii]
MDALDIWCRRPGTGRLLRKRGPLSSPSLHEEIHLRPRVLRPAQGIPYQLQIGQECQVSEPKPAPVHPDGLRKLQNHKRSENGQFLT